MKSTLILVVLLLLITPILWINPVRSIEQNISIPFLNGWFYKINRLHAAKKENFPSVEQLLILLDYPIPQSETVPMEYSIPVVAIAIDCS